MKRYLLWAMFALAAIGVALIANVATIHEQFTALSTTHDEVPDGCYMESSGTGSRPAGARSSGFSPCIVLIPSQPVVPGEPAVSLAPDGTTFGRFHAYAPADICAAYGVDGLHAEGITGKGQTIVIVDSYGSPTALKDLKEFSKAFTLPDPDLTIIYPDGKPTLNSTLKQGWAGETSLDLQWAHAIAPDAKLVLVAANPAETEGVQGFPSMFKGIAYAVEHYPGSVISQSFSVTEQSFRSAAEEQIAKFDKVYQQAVAAGCTVLGSISDTGTANLDKHGRHFDLGGVYPFPTVCWPASDPLVTACGGTWLQWGWSWNPGVSEDQFWAEVASLGDWNLALKLTSFMDFTTGPGRTEAVWNEAWLPAAGGGGLSALFPTPDFQSGLPQDLLHGRRGVPDISWNAAFNGGVLVYQSDRYGYPGPYVNGWSIASGQSAAVPQLAGVIALTNQLRAKNGKGPIGYLNPILYTLPASDFNDIVPETFGPVPVTLDNNKLYGSGIDGFYTTEGYDLTTGLGSPKAYAFVHDLAELVP